MPRLLAMLFVLLGLFCAAALPAHAEDYDTVLDRLSRLQALAREYSANQADTPDPIELTLAYTRTGEYNTTIWQLTAGVRDAGFESCVNSSDPELASLQNMNTVVLPNGESIDFGHLLASMNLVYNGIPITGSWGGDCEELARQYYGQAGDAAGYAEAMRASFNIDDDGTLSRFSNGDLRADLDSVVVGSKVTKDTDLAEALRSYYANLTEYDRVKEFISLSFGTVDTSSTAFADAVYSARPARPTPCLSGPVLPGTSCAIWTPTAGRSRTTTPPPCAAQQTCLPSTWPTRSTTRRSRARRMTVWLPWAGRHWPTRWRRWATPTPPRPH